MISARTSATKPCACGPMRLSPMRVSRAAQCYTAASRARRARSAARRGSSATPSRIRHSETIGQLPTRA
ncbi:MAG: hypothetical protein DIU71_17505 [Proteobacteria bacterium]|nr:MAG: hypothetical protein DIU71_17505 [Pseudomonadota bacterium]